MHQITATIGTDKYITHISSYSGNTITADEPESNGGHDKGFSPDDLLAASLGACTCITLRMYVNHKGWQVDSLEVTVTVDRNEPAAPARLGRTIKIKGNVSEDERSKILAVANKCPIHKTLSQPVQIETALQ